MFSVTVQVLRDKSKCLLELQQLAGRFWVVRFEDVMLIFFDFLVCFKNKQDKTKMKL